MDKTCDLRLERSYIGGMKCWKLFGDFNIEAEELYVVYWKDLADKELKEVIETFQSVCPNHTEECYVILAKEKYRGWGGYIVFPHFEDAHRLHGIIMLLGELEFWSEFGIGPHISYLHDEAEKLVIKLYPNADFVATIFKSRYKRYR